MLSLLIVWASVPAGTVPFQLSTSKISKFFRMKKQESSFLKAHTRARSSHNWRNKGRFRHTDDSIESLVTRFREHYILLPVWCSRWCSRKFLLINRVSTGIFSKPLRVGRANGNIYKCRRKDVRRWQIKEGRRSLRA